MPKTKLLLVVGTRPNYIKITQFKKVASAYFKDEFEIRVVHTGQHFDASMADVFFEQLDLQPDYFLDIPQASPNIQMGEVMIRLEHIIKREFSPDLMLVPGDVNSSLAAALTANKLKIPLGHLESGLRSFDRSMPEEINRILIDEISDLHFVTEQSGIDNLLEEGKPKTNTFFVGNTMIDTLVAFKDRIASQQNLDDLGINKKEFILITLHRPATVDNQEGIELMLELITRLTNRSLVVFPMHPRTKKNIEQFNLKPRFDALENLKILGPTDYFGFQNLIGESKLVLTDSGGIQEETTFKGIPCITLRPNTERPCTINQGSNCLMNFKIDSIIALVDDIIKGNYKTSEVPKLWDGSATKRILEVISTLDINENRLST